MIITRDGVLTNKHNAEPGVVEDEDLEKRDIPENLRIYPEWLKKKKKKQEYH
jgi:hypothetical protein